MNVVIIGAGKIGSRHIESVFKLKIINKLIIIDPNKKNNQIVKKNINYKKNSKKIFFYENIDKFKLIFDILIISTNSDVRKEVLHKFLKLNKVKNIIFEKIVFTNLKDYKNTIKILNQKKIKSYINFPRRIYPFYIKLKNDLDKKKNLSYTLIGSNWGFATNSIHNIDLFLFLTNSKNIFSQYLTISRVSKSKKRNEFLDINASFSLKTKENHNLFLNDYFTNKKVKNKLNGPIKIETIDKSYFIYENLNFVIEIDNKKLKIKKYKIDLPKQSILTAKILINFKKNNNIKLTTLAEGLISHKVLINSLSKELVKINNKYKNNLPIT